MPPQTPIPSTPDRRTARTPTRTPVPVTPEKKRTTDGKIVLEPQPDDSLNDPLNWPAWRRDIALFSLGFFCMLGGGMTPILAAGFNDVSQTYGVTVPRVALTTGLYMMGLGIGSVIMSPTAILYGKRPVYLFGAIIFVLSAIWCALSPNYPSLVVARIFQGIAVSPVECLPSATVAEIFFLHERAYRLGIYTLLLLGGKNLIPLVSAAIINSLGWRWVFWIVAIVVGFGGVLLFFFVPETFWDRTPRPKRRHSKTQLSHISINSLFRHHAEHQPETPSRPEGKFGLQSPSSTGGVAQRRRDKHAHFAMNGDEQDNEDVGRNQLAVEGSEVVDEKLAPEPTKPADAEDVDRIGATDAQTVSTDRPTLTVNTEHADARQPSGYFPKDTEVDETGRQLPSEVPSAMPGSPTSADQPMTPGYTGYYRVAPPKTYRQTLRVYSGRLSKDNWFKVALRPFILFAYPSILWSATVYALSVGWLIVLSESVSTIYEKKTTYNFTALQAGLIYLSPFIGGVLGTAVAGKLSDVIVRYLARRNGGVYEPEFRLVMAIPVALCTSIGLMGYGWSAHEHDAWIVPTLFFGIISFGCCVGSTTAITFAVDSYRQYAGEALVTLNFSKSKWPHHQTSFPKGISRKRTSY